MINLNPQYYNLITALAGRDNTLAGLAVIALAVYAGWLLIPWALPEPWIPTAERLYLWGGGALYILTLLYSGG